MSNFFQTNIVPDKPKILESERVFVYVPKATNTTPGIAKFDNSDFNTNNANVSLKWPIKMQIESLSDPLDTISRVKLLADEFEHTNKIVSITNPVTRDKYSSSLAELQLNRKNRNAFIRPDLVMLSNNDFGTIIDTNGYVKYYLKANNPLQTPSLVKLDNKDFKQNGDSMAINWPYANKSLNSNTNGFGLVKVSDNDYLTFDDNDELTFNVTNFQQKNGIKPSYSGNEQSDFNQSDYITQDGLAKVVDGHPIIAITKEAIGLNKVQNKAFSEYVYTDFGQNMQSHFKSEFDNKLDIDTWEEYFADWNPPTQSKSTLQKWLSSLEAEDESIRDSIKTTKLFLGYFDTIQNLEALYPADKITYGCFAFINSVGHYFSVQSTNTKYLIQNDEKLSEFIQSNLSILESGDTIGIIETSEVYLWNGSSAVLQSYKINYQWYDTNLAELSFQQLAETDALAFMQNGIPSAGSSGKWAQSDHIHPSDTAKLDKDIYKDTTINIVSTYGDGFTLKLWEEDEEGNYIYNRQVNIPYVRKSQYLHNWNGMQNFADSEISQEAYWAGTQADFDSQQDTIKNNSLIVIEDDDIEDGVIVTQTDLDKQGITIDLASADRFIIADVNDIPIGKVLYLDEELSDSGNSRYIAKGIELDATNNLPVVSNNGSITTMTLSQNKVLIGGENGELKSSELDVNTLLRAKSNSAQFTLAANKLLVSVDSNEIDTYDTGEVANRLVVSDGFGAVVTKTFNTDKILVTKEDGSIIESDFNVDNILVSKVSDVSNILPAGEILISGNGNEVTTYDTGAMADKLLVANGTGGIKVSTISANKLIYTSSQGVLSAFPMTSSDIGKFVGVDENGMPTLLSAPVSPAVLPVLTYTSNPGANTNGTVIAKLDSDPGIYSEGVLYLW